MKKMFEDKKWLPLYICLVLAATGVYLGCKPAGWETFRADDGSKWALTNTPGFGNDNNSSVVAMADYKDYLYAMTRNKNGAEVWRMEGKGHWEQVLFPNGQTKGFYGNKKINNIWGRMIVFKDKLYFGAASGFQGSMLNSTGAEIWRYDGTTWAPVISDQTAALENGAITAISGCVKNDGDPTAQFTDSSKSWTTDQWKDATLRITSGDGINRKFYITGNSATSLTIQQGEYASTGPYAPSFYESTICSEDNYTNDFPFYKYPLGAIVSGDTYEIGRGENRGGFGDMWNKTITDMRIFEDKLYVSTGLNYARGSQVWYTADGDTWQVTEPTNSFGNFHNDPTYPDSKKPVSSSLPTLAVSSCSGEPTLYASGTGTTGNMGSCSRVAKLTGAGWELIVDNKVDTNTTGTNENGLGDCPDAQNGNFMVWNMVEFNDKLFAVINSMLGGTRVLYTENGGSADGSWHYSVGCPTGTPQEQCESKYPNGFDNAKYPGAVAATPAYQNIAGYLFVFNNTLYCGTLQMYWGPYRDKNYPNGAHIWKSKDGISWKKITVDGFKDDQIIMFEAFATYKDKLYVSGSKSANTELIGLGGAKVYCQLRESR